MLFIEQSKHNKTIWQPSHTPAQPKYNKMTALVGYERNQVNQEPTRNQEVLNFFKAETCPGSPFLIKPRTETRNIRPSFMFTKPISYAITSWLSYW